VPLRILLIDDNARVRATLAEMLITLGHSVRAAPGGREGLAYLEAGHSVDVVLTDLKMPQMSGWQVVQAVKARWPALRVGVITGTPEALGEQREPVDLVLTKPISLEGLRAAISREDS